MAGVKNGLYKRGSSWWIRVRANGILYRKSFGQDKRAAELALLTIKQQRMLGRISSDWSGLEKLLSPKSQTTFQQAVESYLAERDLKHSSKLAYEDRLKHLLPQFGAEPISSIREEDIARFQKNLINKNLSPARINAIMNLLRTVLKTSVRRRLIEHNPADGVDQVREETPDIDPLTEQELSMVLSHVQEQFRPIFICLAWSGARPGELKALRWQDIDFHRNEIRISRARYKGEESTTKTKSSRRVIEMLAGVKDCLLTLRQSSKVVESNGHVFLGKDGQPIDHHLDRYFTAALKKAGLRHRPSYQLRHTFASIMLQRGWLPGRIAKQLGHSNLSTTFRHYARYIPEQRISEPLVQTAPLLDAKVHKVITLATGTATEFKQSEG